MTIIALPQKFSVIEGLSEADKIRLAEALHLREKPGNDIPRDWKEAEIRMIRYNEEFAFLIE